MKYSKPHAASLALKCARAQAEQELIRECGGPAHWSRRTKDSQYAAIGRRIRKNRSGALGLLTGTGDRLPGLERSLQHYAPS